jgi:hypothetical protein
MVYVTVRWRCLEHHKIHTEAVGVSPLPTSYVSDNIGSRQYANLARNSVANLVMSRQHEGPVEQDQPRAEKVSGWIPDMNPSCSLQACVCDHARRRQKQNLGSELRERTLWLEVTQRSANVARCFAQAGKADKYRQITAEILRVQTLGGPDASGRMRVSFD